MKQSGLGDNVYVHGYNLSGDIGSFNRIGGGPAPSVVTGIDVSAFERIGGLRDGEISYSAWFNPAANRAHSRFSTLPRTDVIVSYERGTTLGSPAAACVAKQINYDFQRGNDASLTAAIQCQSNGFGVEWGIQLTAGVDTSLTAAGALTSVDTLAAADFGLQAYLHVFAFTGTSATVAIQDSSDNGTDPWTDITGAIFTAATGITAQRIQTSRTENVKRYLRVNVTGTFSALSFAVMVNKNQTTVSF